VLLGGQGAAPFRTAVQALKVPKDDEMAIFDQGDLVDDQVIAVGDEQPMPLEHMLETAVEIGTDGGAEEALCSVEVEFCLIYRPARFFERE
jgi:hypothetical protein